MLNFLTDLEHREQQIRLLIRWGINNDIVYIENWDAEVGLVDRPSNYSPQTTTSQRKYIGFETANDRSCDSRPRALNITDHYFTREKRDPDDSKICWQPCREYKKSRVRKKYIFLHWNLLIVYSMIISNIAFEFTRKKVQYYSLRLKTKAWNEIKNEMGNKNETKWQFEFWQEREREKRSSALSNAASNRDKATETTTTGTSGEFRFSHDLLQRYCWLYEIERK